MLFGGVRVFICARDDKKKICLGAKGMKSLMRHVAVLALVPTLSWGQEISFTVDTTNDTLIETLKSASLVEALLPSENPAPQDYVAAARADYRRLLTALYSRGYYGGTISIRVNGTEATNIAPLDAPTAISTITYAVDPGPRFTFGEATVTPLAAGTELPETFATGRSARSTAITEAVGAGVSGWRNAGHAKAAAGAQSIAAQHAENKLNVNVAITPGPLLTFGALTISGDSAVRASRIAKIAGIPEGEIYDPQDLRDAERRLRATGAFDSVSAVEADDIGPNDTLPITLEIADSKPRRIGFGLELSSIEGLKVSSYWLHRNFLGGAERFRVEGEVSGIGGETGGIDYKLGASLDRPAIYGADTDIFSRAEISRLDEPTFLIDKVALEFGLTRPIGEDITAFAGIGLLAAREVTEFGTKTYTLFTLPLGATLEQRDDPTNAKNGYYLNIDATPFVNIDDGSVGARLYSDARVYRSFGATEQLTLAARTQVGSVMGSAIENTPADFLFYSGGGGTVRGQSYDSLGISTTVGDVTTTTGGLSFVGAQIEARYSVTDKIGVVGFYDYGQIGADGNFGGESNWHAGAGIGVRYDTGIGPIRLDIGTPASGDNIGEEVQVYIGIGQSF